MALGYEGIGYVDSIIFLCSGASVPRTRNRIDSASGYGGRLSTPVAEIGIGSPHNYDWSTYDGSVNFELNKKFLDDVVKDWIFARETVKKVELKPRDGSYQEFEDCYWNSINLSASDGSAVTGSIGFVALDRDSFDLEDDYIDNKTGSITCADLAASGDIPALNVGDDVNPIPFWHTRVEASGLIQTGVEAMSWNLSFNQEVVKFFKCEGLQGPQAPFRIGVGPMTITLQMDVMILNQTITSLPDILNNVILHIGTSSLKFDDLEIDSDNDDLQTGASLVPLSLTYGVYKLVA
jgi:hypothetical protein